MTVAGPGTAEAAGPWLARLLKCHPGVRAAVACLMVEAMHEVDSTKPPFDPDKLHEIANVVIARAGARQ